MRHRLQAGLRARRRSRAGRGTRSTPPRPSRRAARRGRGCGRSRRTRDAASAAIQQRHHHADDPADGARRATVAANERRTPSTRPISAPASEREDERGNEQPEVVAQALEDRRRRASVVTVCEQEVRGRPTRSSRSSSTTSSPSAYCARSTFLSNLPTLVFGTSSMNVHRSGSCHLATRPPRNVAQLARRSTVGVALQHDARERALVPPRVGHGDHRRLDDVGMRHQVAFELDRRDPLAARLDDVLRAVGDLDVAVGRDAGDVAGAQPAVVELLGRGIAVVRRR